jgi:hypothetical protein
MAVKKVMKAWGACGSRIKPGIRRNTDGRFFRNVVTMLKKENVCLLDRK